MSREINGGSSEDSYCDDSARTCYVVEPWEVRGELYPRFQNDLQFRKNSWGAAHDQYYQPMNENSERSMESRKYAAEKQYGYAPPNWNHTVTPPTYAQMYEQAAAAAQPAPRGQFPKWDRDIFEWRTQKKEKKGKK
jgi:hypothetical protein